MKPAVYNRVHASQSVQKMLHQAGEGNPRSYIYFYPKRRRATILISITSNNLNIYYTYTNYANYFTLSY